MFPFPPIEDVLSILNVERMQNDSSTGLSILEQMLSSTGGKDIMRLHGDKVVLAVIYRHMDAIRSAEKISYKMSPAHTSHLADIRQADKLLRQCVEISCEPSTPPNDV